MSINVTVSGNPVVIKRGRMVTACNPAKSEFEKRRLMRLEQVRQQSKDIAETIRNKMKKEKTKCLSEIEQEGEIKLKNWQVRKLLELQNQYQEALDEIGVGHGDAERAEDEEEIILEQLKSNDQIARERGRAAAERLQIEKNGESLKKAVPIQRKKITRDIENSRSSVVASLRKVKQDKNTFKKKKKRPQQPFDSDGENKVPQLFELGDMDSPSSASLEATHVREIAPRKISKEQQTSQSQFQVPKSDKAAQTLIQEDILVSDTRDVRFDTRISEHIRRRHRLNQHMDYCDFAENLPLKSTNKTHCACCQCPERPQYQEREGVKLSREIIPTSLEPQRSKEPLRRTDPEYRRTDPEDGFLHHEISTDPPPFKEPINLEETSKTSLSQVQRRKDDSKTKETEGEVTKVPSKSTIKSKKEKQEDIPSKPKITLRSSKDRIAHIAPADSGSKPVQYYDHPNRFVKQYVPKTSVVEKINEDHLDISPNLLSENEIHEKMRQRDIEAHVRGQVALEKERIQREYRELLRKLPALQKQDRIYEIGADKEKYHMSKGRLEEMEKKRQNRLDNAYEELFVRRKPAMVTLSKKKTEEVPSLNLGSWDVDFDLISSSNNNRTEQLNSLLMNLKAQKDSLIKEIENTLSKDTLNELGNIITEETKSTDYSREKSKRKRNRDERPPSPISSDVAVAETESKSKTLTKKTMSPSPRKKAKLKSKKILVLQNTSTQTTPKTAQSASTSPVTNAVISPVTATATAEGTDKCICPKGGLDDLCEIVIRIKEDEKPEVTVNPPTMGKSVKVIKEDKKVEESIGEEGLKKDKSKESSKDENDRSKKFTTGTKTSFRSGSWRDSLSQTNSSQQSTTSTSYFEPPKSSRLLKTARKSPEFEEIWKNSTFSDGSNMLDPRLLTYIKKLLKMSRASIDELAVSASSDVSTPAESVVDTPSNNPLVQLKNVMRYFNLDYTELQKQLSYYSDDNSLHYNTTDSITVSSTTSDGTKSVQLKSCTEADTAKKKKSQESASKLMEYADIAASCTKKISSLTAMIEKVREEKKKMLQSPPTSSTSSDKDMTVTSYLNLPNHKEGEEKESSSSHSSQEDLDKKLLTIDYSYAEKLKQLTDEEIQKEKKRIETTDEDLVSKLQNMLQSTNGFQAVISEKTTVTLTKTDKEKEESPPLFLDIPKLPRLAAPSLDQEKKKRPPPSKGLRVLGGPVPMVPHELSTIIEADSQLSTKMESPMKAAPPPNTSSSSSVPDILTEVPPHKEVKSQSTNSSDEVSEMETMETMLMSIGMEWAIPTLKKTREALALSSSSGSGSKKDSGEVSLREFLSKISASSSSNGSTLSDSQGISLIQVDNRRTSTPILDQSKKEGQPVFLTESDLSSVKEHSHDGSKTG